MFAVRFYNLGMTHHFNSLAEAREYAKKSGFECAVYDADGNWLFNSKPH